MTIAAWELGVSILNLFASCCEAWLEGWSPKTSLTKEGKGGEGNPPVLGFSPIIHGFLLENGGINLKGYDSMGDTSIFHAKIHDLWEEGSISEWQIHQVWWNYYSNIIPIWPTTILQKNSWTCNPGYLRPIFTSPGRSCICWRMYFPSRKKTLEVLGYHIFMLVGTSFTIFFK